MPEPTSVAERFGYNVRIFRNKEGLSQEALAAERGRTQTWLSYIESGAREPSLGDLFWLSHRLGFSIDKALMP
jgi:transcriptional regulator with XRE-family HTH domain